MNAAQRDVHGSVGCTRPKRKHRPSLKDWTYDGFASTRAADFERYKDMCIDEMNVVHPLIDRVSCTDISPEEFVEKYEKPCKPVIIKGIPKKEEWKATKEWNSFRRLKKKLGRRMFKVGEDDDGYKVKVKFKYFSNIWRRIKMIHHCMSLMVITMRIL